jgi:hypothetical protein
VIIICVKLMSMLIPIVCGVTLMAIKYCMAISDANTILNLVMCDLSCCIGRSLMSKTNGVVYSKIIIFSISRPVLMPFHLFALAPFDFPLLFQKVIGTSIIFNEFSNATIIM